MNCNDVEWSRTASHGRRLSPFQLVDHQARFPRRERKVCFFLCTSEGTYRSFNKTWKLKENIGGPSMGWFHALLMFLQKWPYSLEMTPAVLEDEGEKVQLSVLASLRRGSRSIHVSQLPYSWLSSLLETRACTQARSSARRIVEMKKISIEEVYSPAPPAARLAALRPGLLPPRP